MTVGIDEEEDKAGADMLQPTAQVGLPGGNKPQRGKGLMLDHGIGSSEPGPS